MTLVSLYPGKILDWVGRFLAPVKIIALAALVPLSDVGLAWILPSLVVFVVMAVVDRVASPARQIA